MLRRGILLALLLGSISATGIAYEADLTYAEGIVALTGACFIRGIKLETDAPDKIEWPEAEGDALYGELRLAESMHSVMIDRTADRITLHVDADRSGDVAPFEWERMLSDGSLLASVPMQIGFDDGTTAPYRVFVMWRAFTPTVLTYCRDTYREGSIDLKDAAYDLVLIDDDTDGRYDLLDGGALLIDADRNGELLASSDSHERFRLDEPFNLDGTTYRAKSVAPDGSRIVVEISDEYVAPKPALLVGFPAPEFEATDADGESVVIEQLRGSILVLDFWAGWCAPCITELPTLEEIHERFSGLGVMVVGINLDRSVEEFEQAVAQYSIAYRQIYDGADGPVNTLYRIEGIPMTYVIDPGGIIRGRGLRGEGLLELVESLAVEEEDDSGGANDP